MVRRKRNKIIKLTNQIHSKNLPYDNNINVSNVLRSR